MSQTKSEGAMLRTPDFGDISFSGNHVFTFSEGLHGFEHLRKFILIAEEATEPFKWLISIENPAIGFALINPGHIDQNYTIGEPLGENVVPMVIVALVNDALGTTTNMKAPILFDCSAMTGQQILLSGSNYSHTHQLARQQDGAGVVQTTSIRRLYTSQFGVLDVASDNILTFSEGLLGFEKLREFVLISIDETEPMKWLVSIEEPSIGFPLLSPWIIDADYDLRNSYDPSTQAAFVVVTLVNPQGKMSANMKAPVLISGDHTGKQIILNSDKYSPTYEINRSKSA